MLKRWNEIRLPRRTGTYILAGCFQFPQRFGAPARRASSFPDARLIQSIVPNKIYLFDKSILLI